VCFRSVFGSTSFVCLFVFVAEVFRYGSNFVGAYFSLVYLINIGIDRPVLFLVCTHV
jgi:hypothetical protein